MSKWSKLIQLELQWVLLLVYLANAFKLRNEYWIPENPENYVIYACACTLCFVELNRLSTTNRSNYPDDTKN